jgi:hypothetical protein
MVAFTFDSATPSLQAVIDSIAGDEYSVFVDSAFSNWSDDIASGPSLTSTVSGSDMGTLTAGRTYAVGVIHYDAHEILACTTLTAGADSEYVLPVTWTYDGSGSVTATFTAPPGFVGFNWVLQAIDYNFFDLGSTFVFTTGSPQTGSLTFTPPVSGDVMFMLWRGGSGADAGDFAIARATVGSTTVNKGSYTWNAAATGFTISADPTAATHTTAGSIEIVIDVGEVDTPEIVNLTVDDSGLPFGITAALDVSSGTTPFTATLTLTAAAGTACEEGAAVVVTGDDGTFTHDVTVTVVVDGTDGTYDELGADGAQAGSDMLQTAAPYITQGTMCVFQNELYFAWLENSEATGPFLAKWNGADWDLIADATIFGAGPVDGGDVASQIQMATDGDLLFLAFERERTVVIVNCHEGGPETITPFFADCWQFDGTTWTFLGSTGSGLIVNDGGGDLTSTLLELSAGPEEPGACYVAFFEEGFEGNSEISRWFSRHLTVAGLGTSTLGVVSFDGLLWQMDRPVDELGRCVAPVGAGAHGYAMRLVGTGDTLALYSQAYGYDQFLAPYQSVLNLWTPGGGVEEIDLATSFPHDMLSGTFIGYGGLTGVSESDLGGRRWVEVAAFTSFSNEARRLAEP